ncbi:unnamed protein product [Ambrosiozyma monospora]|uniref:Unnamed protein product n=1 Tax=Ambrosiozyma monospora TaxID=43982 RepID=A0A9W7DJQ3_AMBMO|nr:unnamed protein product [Ambrosiozyma monospora]
MPAHRSAQRSWMKSLTPSFTSQQFTSQQFTSQQIPSNEEYTVCAEAAKNVIQLLKLACDNQITDVKYIAHSDQISNNVHNLERWLSKHRSSSAFETVLYMVEHDLPQFIPLGMANVITEPMTLDDDGNSKMDVLKSPWNDVPAGSFAPPCMTVKPACKSWYYQCLAIDFTNLMHLTLNYGKAARELVNGDSVSSIFIDTNPHMTLHNLRYAKSVRGMHPNLIKYLEYLQFNNTSADKNLHTISSVINTVISFSDDLEIAEKADPYARETILWCS